MCLRSASISIVFQNSEGTSVPVSCMVVDDEPLAREVLAAHIARVDTLALQAQCESADEAFSRLQKSRIDLLFLDIEMPGLSGLGLLRSLRNPPSVIITTAHRDYAVEGFDLDVTDYLLKPISFERFLRAVEKYFATKEQRDRVDAAPQAEEDVIMLRADRKMHRVPLSDILYLESMKDYVRVRTTQGSITVRSTIAALEQELPEGRFLRIHRGIIVAIARIDAFTTHSVEIGTHELTIGRNYRAAALQVLQNTKEI
ncbi:LytTR family DNA-binding domain-containing protein [bacterium]|nr:LytTR family DNA-binding domain-containing protein [bacterium]